MNELVTYTPPSPAEIEGTLQLALRLSKTNFVPAAYRGKPDETLACMLTGRELGIGQMQALRDIFIQNGRPAMLATLMAQLARRAGHKVTVLDHTNTQCTIQIHRHDKQRPEQPLTWTIEDAKTAGLLGKDNWKHYPKAMLWNRAVSAAVRRDCSEVLGGVLYTPEELGAGDTDVTWGEVEVDQAIGEVYDSGRLDGDSTPAQPAGHVAPTLDEIRQVRSVRAAKELVQAAPEPFRSRMPKAIDALHHGEPRLVAPRDFWALADLDQWKQVLEYAVELHEQQQHEMSAAGSKAPPAPAADPPSAPGAASPAAGSDPSSNPGRADRRTREGSTESAMTPGLDDPVGGDDDAAS